MMKKGFGESLQGFRVNRCEIMCDETLVYIKIGIPK
jgi:hypothetical protein